MHTLPWCGLIFPFQLPYFLHWLLSSTLVTQLKPPEASEQAAKKAEGTALKFPPRLTRPGPCEPKFWKNDLPVNLFLLCVLPQKHNKLTLAFKEYFTYTIESPEASEQAAKKSWGRCPRAPAGAYVPRTLWTQVPKKWPPSQLVFAVHNSPKA